jgi:tetratricopeptide (TPR) repeat protein
MNMNSNTSTPKLLLAVCIGTLACSSAEAPASGNDKSPTAAATPEAKSPTATPAVEPNGKAPTPEPAADDPKAQKRAEARGKISASDDELRQRRAQMLTTLNEGRALVKAGELEAGIAKYQELLAIDPQYGPALGELGWAEFQAEKLDVANAHTLRALSVATDDNQRGMLFYNLGRIAEARQQIDVARAHYQVSLSVRPNDIVAARLAGLPPTEAPTAPTMTTALGLGVLATGLPDIGAVCELVGRESMCAGSSCELVASPDPEQRWGAIEVHDDWAMGCWHPAMNTANGWMVFDSALVAQRGSEVEQDIDEITSRVESNAAGEFLLIGYADHLYERMWAGVDIEDENAEIPEDDMTEAEGVVICSSALAACTQPITLAYTFTSEGDPKQSYTAKLSLRGDVIVIADVLTEGPVELGKPSGRLPAGEYPFAELSAR